MMSKRFLKQIVIAVILVAVGIFGASVWLSVTTHHDQKIRVPDLSRLSLSEVDTILKELDLRFEVIDSASFNPSYPIKSVIEQSPEKGTFVKEKRKLYLTLNPSKYGDVEIKEFYGKTKNEVEAQLRAVGFVVGEYFYVPDIGKNVVRKLKFRGKEINQGDKLAKNSVIDLVLGNGKRY